MTSSPPLTGASQPATSIAFDVPAGACDCLTHIFGDPARFPLSPTRTYTPEPASIAEILALHRALQITRVVIVQPTIYGTDNACTLDALEQLGASARGVAVVDATIPATQLDEMDRQGVRGIRVNLETVGLSDPAVARERLQAAIARVKDRRTWHIQVYTRPRMIDAMRDLLETCPVHVSFDHFGGARLGDGSIDNRGFGLVLELLRAGKASVKLSAPYLASSSVPGFADVVPLARQLVAANPSQVLWGTNWPHPNSGHGERRRPSDVSPLRRVDDGAILNLMPLWVPDADVRKAILVDNPARLYGFDAA
ncbi:MAG: amidohydrolase [Vicinamibacterales bacterium]